MNPLRTGAPFRRAGIVGNISCTSCSPPCLQMAATPSSEAPGPKARLCVMSYHCLSLAWGMVMGNCRYCGRNAGWFRHSHRQCAEIYRRSLAQMVELVAQVAERPDFSRHRMLQALAGPAQERYVPDQDLPAVVAAGWHLSSMNRMVDHIPPCRSYAMARVSGHPLHGARGTR